MFDPSKIADIANKLQDSLPEPLKNAQTDIGEKFKQILQAQFAKLDLVTREEFDTYVEVLQKTRQKVEELEKELEDLKNNHS